MSITSEDNDPHLTVAVYGASGFTGGLVVAELRRRGIPVVAVGRSVDRLRALGGDIRVAPLDDPARLAEAFRECDAVINAAGPFTPTSSVVVRAALTAGAHYVDTSGEHGQIRDVLDEFDPMAKQAGHTVVPALADDGGPGDLIASLTAANIATVDEVLIGDLREPGAASRGTARSMAMISGAGPLEYLDGTWGSVNDAPEPVDLVDGPVAVTAFPLPGVVTVPRHIGARRVRAVIRSEVANVFTSLTPEVVESVPEIVPVEVRQASRWFMYASARGGGQRADGWVTGPDAYGLTAVIAVEGAVRLAGGEAPAGALTPAQAFDPAGFLDALTPHDVSWQVKGPYQA
jgi:short subunit dehydrogenase-like uncharacterized protein